MVFVCEHFGTNNQRSVSDIQEKDRTIWRVMPINKTTNSFADAVADIPSGASIMIGGFGGAGGQPTRLMMALRDLGVGDLTIIGNVAGISKTTGYGWPDHLDPIDQWPGDKNHLLVSRTWHHEPSQ